MPNAGLPVGTVLENGQRPSQNLTEGILLQDMDGGIRGGNAMAEQLLGYPHEQMRGWKLVGGPWRIVHPDGTPCTEASDPTRVVSQTGQPCLGVILGIGREAQPLTWVHINAHLLVQGSPIPDAIVITLRPVAAPLTSLNCTSSPENLLQPEHPYSDLAQALPLMIWIADATGVIQYGNPCWCDYTGIARTQSLGRGGLEVVHPEDRDRTWQQWGYSLATATAFEIEQRLCDQQGQYRWFLNRCVPIHNAQGQLTGWIGCLIDSPTDLCAKSHLGDLPPPMHAVVSCTHITERQRIEEEQQQTEIALHQSQAMLQQQLAEIEAIYQSAPIGLNVLDANLRFVRINQKLAEINGLPIEAHIGRTIREIVPDLADMAEQILRPILETGEPLMNVEISGTTLAQPGVQRFWLEHFLPLKDGDRVIGISTVCEEITERKRDEARRQQVEEALRQSEARLRQQTEQLAQANRIKDDFLAILSHELRTPLNPILGWVKLLQADRFTTDRQQQALQTIERNAQRLVQLIDDLLDISRVIRGKLTLNPHPISLKQPILAALETVYQAAIAKALHLEVDLDPSVGDVLGDEGKLQQVVWNLLSNAIKFTPEGGQIRVQLTQGDRKAELRVADTGKGIAPDFLPHIFEMFRQQDSSTTRQFGGLGLGLALSWQIVQAHGGSIEAQSAGEGQGSMFTVRLPLLLTSPPPLSTSSLPNAAVQIAGMRLLVVDDEPDTLAFMQIFLESYKAEVITAISALEALDILMQTSIDVLISDIQIPQMDGYAFMGQIRALAHLQTLPAIALTAYAYETDRERILAAGYQRHLTKPIDSDALLRAIAELAQGHHPL